MNFTIKIRESLKIANQKIGLKEKQAIEYLLENKVSRDVSGDDGSRIAMGWITNLKAVLEYKESKIE